MNHQINDRQSPGDISENLVIRSGLWTIPTHNNPYTSGSFFVENIYPDITPTPSGGVITWSFGAYAAQQKIPFQKEERHLGKVLLSLPEKRDPFFTIAEIEFTNGKTCVLSYKVDS